MLHWTVTALLLAWGLAYAGLVVFTFFLATPAHWTALVRDGRITRSYADHIARLPRWVVGVTLAAAATRLAGAVLLALFRAGALPVYAVSFVLVAVIMFRGFALAGVTKVIRPGQVALELVFLLMSALAVLFAWYEAQRGILG